MTVTVVCWFPGDEDDLHQVFNLKLGVLVGNDFRGLSSHKSAFNPRGLLNINYAVLQTTAVLLGLGSCF